MAETFTSYRAKSNNSSGTVIIVPKSGESNIIGDSREANSTTQIHSIYVSQVLQNHLNESQLEENMNFFHLAIRDNLNTIFIAHDIPLVPQSAYYVEKTLTLLPSQELVIIFQESAGKNGVSGYEVDALACAVDLT